MFQAPAEAEVRLDAMRSLMEAEILQHEQKNKELESKLNELAKENQRLQAAAAQKKKELDELKAKSEHDKSALANEIEDLKLEIDRLKKADQVCLNWDSN